MKDTAYTSLALPAHTDTTYFSDPAGLQMFHLLSHTDGQGGESLLVDGFACAKQMAEIDPELYSVLRRVRVPWHASGNEGIVITPTERQPVFAHYKVDSQVLKQIRWNNDDRGIMNRQPKKDISYRMWYNAARLWNSILKDAKNEYWEQLKPGRPVGMFLIHFERGNPC